MGLLDDVLLEVFMFLGGSDTRSACLVCKRWNKLLKSMQGRYGFWCRLCKIDFPDLHNDQVHINCSGRCRDNPQVHISRKCYATWDSQRCMLVSKLAPYRVVLSGRGSFTSAGYLLHSFIVTFTRESSILIKSSVCIENNSCSFCYRDQVLGALIAFCWDRSSNRQECPNFLTLSTNGNCEKVPTGSSLAPVLIVAQAPLGISCISVPPSISAVENIQNNVPLKTWQKITFCVQLRNNSIILGTLTGDLNICKWRCSVFNKPDKSLGYCNYTSIELQSLSDNHSASALEHVRRIKVLNGPVYKIFELRNSSRVLVANLHSFRIVDVVSGTLGQEYEFASLCATSRCKSLGIVGCELIGANNLFCLYNDQTFIVSFDSTELSGAPSVCILSGPAVHYEAMAYTGRLLAIGFSHGRINLFYLQLDSPTALDDFSVCRPSVSITLPVELISKEIHSLSWCLSSRGPSLLACTESQVVEYKWSCCSRHIDENYVVI